MGLPNTGRISGKAVYEKAAKLKRVVSEGGGVPAFVILSDRTLWALEAWLLENPDWQPEDPDTDKLGAVLSGVGCVHGMLVETHPEARDGLVYVVTAERWRAVWDGDADLNEHERA